MLRSKRNIAMATSAAVIATTALSGASLVGTADASSVSRTMKFVAISDRGHGAGHFGFVGTEIDKKDGRRVGFDVLSGRFNPATEQVKIYIAIARRGGLLFGRVHSTSDTTYAGKVTGGSGRFAGASGNITAHNGPVNDERTYVTIHYTLP